ARGARPWAARTRQEYAEMLLTRNRPGDREKALALLARALEAAQEMGQKSVVEKALAAKLRAQGVGAREALGSIDAVLSSVQAKRPNLQAHASGDGTLTIVFTDIEGSTAMVDRLGDDRARELLGAHNRLVREHVRAHDGFEVQCLGDGFMLVFRSARHALRCAIAIQRALADYSVPHLGAPLRVRIGLHAGETVRNADAFFGRAVYKAARIAAHAQGGEIVVSGLFRELTENAEEFRFHSRRQVELKGLSGPCEVYNVAWQPAGAATPAVDEPPRSSGDVGTGHAQEEAATSAAQGDPPSARLEDRLSLLATLRREGDYWTLAYAGSVSRVREMKGLHYLAHLLEHPGQEVHVLDLIWQASAGGRALDEDRPPAAGGTPPPHGRGQAARSGRARRPPPG